MSGEIDAWWGQRLEAELAKWMAQAERDRVRAENDRARLVAERDEARQLHGKLVLDASRQLSAMEARAEAAEADNAALLRSLRRLALGEGTAVEMSEARTMAAAGDHPGAALLEEVRRLRELRTTGERLALAASYVLGMLPEKSGAQAKLAACIEAWSVIHG